MQRLLATILFTLCLVLSTSAATYYVSTSGSGTACSLGSPCSLSYAFGNQAVFGPGDTIYLRGGTYSGKFTSTLDGGTVRSYPGEWAVINGYVATTLNGAINDTQTSFTLTNASAFGLVNGSDIVIDNEVIRILAASGNSVTNSLRGASGSNYGIGGDPDVAHSNGAAVYLAGDQLLVSGSNTTYRDFEVTNSIPTRDGNTTGLYRAQGNIVNSGASNSFINLLIHDVGNGIFTGSGSSNTLIYGCVIFNNGFHYNQEVGPDEVPAGHGLYLENSAGYSRVYNTLSLNNFHTSMKGYGVTGPYVGGDVDGSVFVNAGSQMRKYDSTYGTWNVLIGTDSQASPTASVKNSHIYHPAEVQNAISFRFGYNTIDAGTVTDNYIVGGNAFELTNTTALTFTGNKMYTTEAWYLNVPTPGSYTWNNNTYYGSQGTNKFIGGGSPVNFAGWKTATGFDAASTETSGNVPDTVVVLPNTYETGRCNLIVYAASAPASINIDLATCGLVNGQAYTIKNAFDWFGGNVATGTYNSGATTVSVPLNGEADDVATATGYDYTPATTCPNLCVMVLMPGSAPSAIPVQAGGGVSFGGGVKLQ